MNTDLKDKSGDKLITSIETNQNKLKKKINAAAEFSNGHFKYLKKANSTHERICVVCYLQNQSNYQCNHNMAI